MTHIYLMLIGFGLFAGIISHFGFKSKKPLKIQFVGIIAIILFSLIFNFAAFVAFNEIIKPLIPCDKYDGSYGWYVGIIAGGAILSVSAIGLVLGSITGLSKSYSLKQFFEATPIPKTASPSEEGKYSILKCPKCSKFLSIRWIVFSMYTTKYSCRGCGASLVWTKRRMIVGGIVGASAGPLVILSNLYFGSYWPAFFLLPIIIIPLFLLPGQYRLEE